MANRILTPAQVYRILREFERGKERTRQQDIARVQGAIARKAVQEQPGDRSSHSEGVGE